MHYVSVEELTKSFGIKPLFSNISFHIEEGDKIALVARNGSGKTTLLKILAGKETADEGKVWINKDVDVVLFEQDPIFTENESVLNNIFFHDHPIINAIKEYEAAADEANQSTTGSQQSAAGNLERLNHSIAKMDELGAWNFEAKVKQVLGRLQIHHLQQNITTLSGGQRKRVALAKTLIDVGFEHKHVLLIMDEPTNHLDVEMVEWLENYLSKENTTLLLVTHDRYFLDTVCKEIWEMDNDRLYVYKGDYENYLEKKVARVESDTASVEKARNTYRKELEWMRKQPRARTTKSKSRQDNFYTIEKKAKQKMADDQLQLEMKMNRLGGKIAELKKVYKSYGQKVILKGFDYTFKKGDRIGIIGKNGTGKTTLLNILQGIEKPDSGKINIGDTVIFGHYSQQGLQAKDDPRVIEYVKSIAESFPLAKGGSLNAAQFLELFLFPPDKQYTYLSMLSGGEKKRLQLLTILFRNPNFLILDEPTNDLDLPTLAVLENFLSEFQGCLLLVSHDRYFMDRLIDHLFVFEGDGVIKDFPGNYTQYRQSTFDSQQSTVNWLERKIVPGISHPQPSVTEGQPKTLPITMHKKQLSYKEKREFDLLEKQIAELTKEKEEVTRRLNSGAATFEELKTLSHRIGEISISLDEKELRWLELSEYVQ
ncbi:MAG TPA: ABC-F family ATP-binding cassette domain-containing protein [Chitinophagaceae bacterium]|nr:ABC-F family ATP-binding cassette domain-containing protein [Chitinophagaceae bacterium]